jgi:hypothetical protein
MVPLGQESCVTDNDEEISYGSEISDYRNKFGAHCFCYGEERKRR